MKENEIQDERILLERRKIQSKGYAYVVTILLISVIVQQFFLKAPFAQYAVEFYVLLGCGFYNIIMSYKNSIDIWNPRNDKKAKIFMDTVKSGIMSVILFMFLSDSYEVYDLISLFTTFVVFFFATRLIMMYINNKKQEAINKELDDDSDE